MLENWHVTACRLNESGSGYCLSDPDSNLLCCQILEPIGRPSLFHRSPHQTRRKPQARCRAPAVPPSCVSNWNGNKTEFPQILEKKKEERKRDPSLPHLETICFPEHKGRNYNNWKAHCKTQIQRAKGQFKLSRSHSNHLIQGSNKAHSFFPVLKSVDRGLAAADRWLHEMLIAFNQMSSGNGSQRSQYQQRSKYSPAP